MKTKVILSQQMASAIIAAGQEEAQKNNWSVSIAVADDGGHLLALSRMDDCAPIARRLRLTSPRRKRVPPRWGVVKLRAMKRW